MLDLVAVMYMYCSLVLSTPNADTTALTTQAVVQAYPQLAPSVPTPAQPQDVQPANIDYLEELKKMGYYAASARDEDLNIRNAVIHFQSDHNLIVDGDFGDNSFGVLKDRLKDKSFAYPDIVSISPPKGKWITINKTKRILTLYDNKTVVKKFPVAVGTASTQTPEGKFTIVCKVVNPDWGGGGYAKPIRGGIPENPLGYRWLGLSVGGGGDYGVHGNNSPYSIGTDASHGCVRMCNPDVENLFELVPIGTEIWIGSDEQIEKWGISQKVYGVKD